MDLLDMGVPDDASVRTNARPRLDHSNGATTFCWHVARHRRSFAGAAIAGFLLAAAGPASAQNVVVNGGFETGTGTDAPPWVFSGIATVSNVGGLGGLAHSGQNYAGLAATFGLSKFDGGISQTVDIRRGGVYQLTYFAGNFSAFHTTTFTLTSKIDGRPILSTIVKSDPSVEFAYEKLTARVRLKRGDSILSLLGVANLAGFDIATLLIDDISLTFQRPFSLNFRNLDLTRNERAVADALYTATKGQGAAGGALFGALAKVSTAQAPGVLDSLSGEGITAAQNVANRSSQLFTSSIFDQTTFYGGGAANAVTLTEPAPGMVALAARQGQQIRELADLPASNETPAFVAPARTWRAWATGFGGAEDIHGNAEIGSAAQSNDIYGGALGVDYQILANVLIGVAVGGSSGDFRVTDRATSGSTTGGHVALYDIATLGAFYGASSISFSDFDNKTNRMIGGFGGLAAESLRGHFNSNEVRGRLEVGRHFAGLSGTLTPFVAIEAASLSSNGFGETSISGANLLGLNVAGQSTADAPGFVGLRFQNAMPLGSLTFLPTLQVAYEHEFAPYRQQTATLADLPGAIFLVDGARPSRNAAQVKAGGELKVGAASAIFANFEGELSGVAQAYAGKGGFKYVW